MGDLNKSRALNIQQESAQLPEQEFLRKASKDLSCFNRHTRGDQKIYSPTWMELGELSNWHKGRFTVIAVGTCMNIQRNLVITRTMEFPLLYQVFFKQRNIKSRDQENHLVTRRVCYVHVYPTCLKGKFSGGSEF